MGYYEGEVSGVGAGNNGGMLNDGWWGIILIALLFGWGRNGFGGNVGNDGAFSGYELGKMATQTDVNNGFATNNILNGIGDVKLGQSSLTTAINQSGYETRAAISELGFNMQNCCCQTQRAIDGVNYNIAKESCDILNAVNTGFNAVINNQNKLYTDFIMYDSNKEITNLRAENQNLSGQLSQLAQTSQIINSLKPTAIPAYITCSPYQASYGLNVNNGCGGSSIL